MRMPDFIFPHLSRPYFEKSDFRQVYIIAKNETIKNVRGKKFATAAAIIIMVFALITLIPIILNHDVVAKGAGDMVSNYLSFVTMFVTLIAALVGGVSIVSEYEERTALILFTRPVKKTTIFLGKFISSFLVCSLMMVAYYIGVAIVGFCYFGKAPDHLMESLGMCLMFVFAAVCISFLFSSIFRKGSVSIIATILSILVVIPIITMMIDGDTSFMLNTAGNSTITCIPEYVNIYNKAVLSVDEYFGGVLQALYEMPASDFRDWLIERSNVVHDIIRSFMPYMDAPDLVKNAVVMFGWGAVSLIASWLLFLRKQF